VEVLALVVNLMEIKLYYKLQQILVTNENRGGLWLGPGSTTSYDQNTGTFSATDNSG
jgi:hypothetical protein